MSKQKTIVFLWNKLFYLDLEISKMKKDDYLVKCSCKKKKSLKVFLHSLFVPLPIRLK